MGHCVVATCINILHAPGGRRRPGLYRNGMVAVGACGCYEWQGSRGGHNLEEVVAEASSVFAMLMNMQIDIRS